MAYKKCFVAFLDVLGFKSMAGDFKKVSEAFSIIEEAIEKSTTPSEAQIEPNDPIKASIMSDSIVLSIICPEAAWHEKLKALRFLLHAVEKIQLGNAINNIWLRGGVAFGGLSHTETNVFGPGMVRAIELEKQATYPRVIMDSRIALEAFSTKEDLTIRSKFINHMNRTYDHSEYSGLFLYNTESTGYEPAFFRNDVPFFIHYLNTLNDNEDGLGEVYEHLKKNIAQAGTVDIYQKYKWVAEYLCSFVTDIDVVEALRSL